MEDAMRRLNYKMLSTVSVAAAFFTLLVLILTHSDPRKTTPVYPVQTLCGFLLCWASWMVLIGLVCDQYWYTGLEYPNNAVRRVTGKILTAGLLFPLFLGAIIAVGVKSPLPFPLITSATFVVLVITLSLASLIFTRLTQVYRVRPNYFVSVDGQVYTSIDGPVLLHPWLKHKFMAYGYEMVLEDFEVDLDFRDYPLRKVVVSDVVVNIWPFDVPRTCFDTPDKLQSLASTVIVELIQKETRGYKLGDFLTDLVHSRSYSHDVEFGDFTGTWNGSARLHLNCNFHCHAHEHSLHNPEPVPIEANR